MRDQHMERMRAAAGLGLDVLAIASAADGMLRPRDKLLVAWAQAECPREQRTLLKLAQDAEQLRERVRAMKNRMAARRRRAAQQATG